MKTVAVERTNLKTCVSKAQQERIVVTHAGNPVALIVGIEGLDREQAQLGASSKFWKLIRERRKEKTITRTALVKKLKRRSLHTRRVSP